MMDNIYDLINSVEIAIAGISAIIGFLAGIFKKKGGDKNGKVQKKK